MSLVAAAAAAALLSNDDHYLTHIRMGIIFIVVLIGVHSTIGGDLSAKTYMNIFLATISNTSVGRFTASRARRT